MIMMLSMTMMMSMIFIFMKHPLSMGMILLIQTILTALITGLLSLNFWFSYILFLIMIGGMLVLFIYMTSIASNEKFSFSLMLTLSLIISVILSMMIYFILDNKMISLMNFSSTYDHTYYYSMNLSKFFNYPSNIILFTMIIYLFITLIAVVKITDINFGPLRQKF